MCNKKKFAHVILPQVIFSSKIFIIILYINAAMTTKENISSKSENLEKAKWINSFYTKILLDICMDEIQKCEKLKISFKNKKWEELREAFNKDASKNYTKKTIEI